MTIAPRGSSLVEVARMRQMSSEFHLLRIAIDRLEGELGNLRLNGRRVAFVDFLRGRRPAHKTG